MIVEIVRQEKVQIKKCKRLMVVITDKGEGWAAVRNAGRAGVPTAEAAGPQGGPGREGGSAEGGQDEPPDCPETESAPCSGGNLTDQGLHWVTRFMFVDFPGLHCFTLHTLVIFLFYR